MTGLEIFTTYHYYYWDETNEEKTLRNERVKKKKRKSFVGVTRSNVCFSKTMIVASPNTTPWLGAVTGGGNPS